MKKPLRVLLVEDSEQDTELLVRELTRAGYDLSYERVQTAETMTAALERGTWDLILSDFSMPRFSAPAALSVLHRVGRDLPFIIVSGTVDEETAVASLKAGAHDFLSKTKLTRLAPAIERELRDANERRERRLLEVRLQKAQRMEAVGQLAGGIAHDFNNMLTAILGYSEMLVKQTDPENQIGQDVREVLSAALRAAVLTRQLLAFSRTQVLSIAPLSLNDVVRGVEPMLRRLLGETIVIETALAADLHFVMGDAAHLEHLLVNLAVNARDAMPRGGRLRIETRNIDLDSQFAETHPGATAGPSAALIVSDTGTGMAPEVLARIFEPFFTTKERGRGTGLGLAAAHGTVTQLGGYIDAASQPGAGSTFTIYFPKTDRTPEAVISRDLAIESGYETILVVEDEYGVRAFVRKALERAGYHVLEAKTAEAAIELVTERQDSIHLLLSDIVLPGLTGPALASRLKEKRPALRVLFMTGYADRQARELAELHTDECLEKPFSTQLLLTKVRQMLGHEAPRSSD